jgi:poly-gamma-glutamate capsule biosynthesis protein CapA/YwtB (metallophosphatase superfamily)
LQVAAVKDRSAVPKFGKKPAEVNVLIASDWAPIRAFDELMRSRPEAVYGDLLPVLRGADLRIVNCECALTAASQAVWKSGAVFKGAPEHVRALDAVPFDVACLANNHVFDYGVAGFRETLKILRRAGLRTVGAGMTAAEAWAPLSLKVKGAGITIVNVSEGEDLTAARSGPGVCGWDIERTSLLIRKCKARGGCVIAIAHCGLEYIPHPPPYVAAAFRAFADAGADCVVGHHPHVPQGIEWYRGKPIAYSLGNFAFFQLTDLYYRKIGFCISLKVLNSAVSEIELHPYRITDAGLRQLTGRELAGFHQTMKRISRPLETPAGVEKAWQAYLDYYGMQGFRNEVQEILNKLQSEPQKAAAMFRNRITTMQHVELWRDFLTRVMSGEIRPRSQAASLIVQEYLTRRVRKCEPNARQNRHASVDAEFGRANC